MKKVEAKWKLASRKPPKKDLPPLPTFICCLASFSLVKRNVLKLLSKLINLGSLFQKEKAHDTKIQKDFFRKHFCGDV